MHCYFSFVHCLFKNYFKPRREQCPNVILRNSSDLLPSWAANPLSFVPRPRTAPSSVWGGELQSRRVSPYVTLSGKNECNIMMAAPSPGDSPATFPPTTSTSPVSASHFHHQYCIQHYTYHSPGGGKTQKIPSRPHFPLWIKPKHIHSLTAWPQTTFSAHPQNGLDFGKGGGKLRPLGRPSQRPAPDQGKREREKRAGEIRRSRSGGGGRHTERERKGSRLGP